MRSFLFPAEDGIRDHCVTGVQTCALPISFPLEDSMPPALDGTAQGEAARRFSHHDSPRRSSKDGAGIFRSEEHTSELQSHSDLVCRLLLEKKKNTSIFTTYQRYM